MYFHEELKKFHKTHPIQEKNVDGVCFDYVLSGSGEHTFVLLAGGTGYADGFYRHVLALEHHGRVLLPWYPTALENNDSLADGIAALAMELGLTRLILVGQSYGGLLAQTIAKRHPQQVHALVLSNTGTVTEETAADEALQAMLERQRAALKLIPQIPADKGRTMMLTKLGAYLDHVPDESRPYLQEMFDAMADFATTKRSLHMTGLLADALTSQRFHPEDFRLFAGRVLLILSQDDQAFSETIRQALIELMPAPAVNRSLSGGHLAMSVQIDAFITAILTFTAELFEEGGQTNGR